VDGELPVGSPTFLIVDDSAVARRVLSFTLNGLDGSRIIEATDGLDALKKLTKEQPDIIFVDLYMPTMDGWKLIEAIRENRDSAGVPVIVISTLADEETQKRCSELGVSAFFEKPADQARLLLMVRRILYEKQ
jgi:CheY-like chemotaxis protein